MQIFGWIRRAFAAATEEGIRDGLKAAGFVPVEDGADESPRMTLWLTNGHVKALPPVAEKALENANTATEAAPAKKVRK